MSFPFHSKPRECKESEELGYLEKDVFINQNHSYFTKSVIARLVLSFTFCDNFDLPISHQLSHQLETKEYVCDENVRA